MLKMIGEAIVFIFTIIMCQTQKIARSRALTEAVFDKELFGTFATNTVVKEISVKYGQKKHLCSMESSTK